VCFVDGHCRIASKEMLAAVARLMADSSVHCISRPQRLYADSQQIFQRAVVLARASRFGHAADSTIYEQQFVERVCDPASAGAIYRRSVFDQVGAYDETFDACEDVELNVRVRQAGLKAVLSSAVEIFYVARSSPRALFKQMARYGAGRIRLMRKHASERSLKVFVPLAILVFLALTPLASLTLPWPINLVWAALLAIYALALLCTGLLIATKDKDLTFMKQVRMTAAVAFALLVIHVGLGWGELQALLTANSSKAA
jgi:GT2 family glycosyltransferase